MYQLEQQFFVISTLFILAVLYMFASVLRINILEPIKIFLVPWIMMMSLILAGFVWYDKIFNVTTYFITILSIISFFAGALINRSISKKRGCSHSNISLRNYSKKNQKILSIGAIVYFIFVTNDLVELIISGIDISLRSFYIEHWAEYHENEKDIFILMKNLAEVCALFSAISLPIFIKNKISKFVIFISIVSWLVIIASSIIEGTRFMMALLFIASAYIVIYLNAINISEDVRRKRERKKIQQNKLLIIGAVSVLIVLFVVYPSARNPDLAGDVNYSLNRHHESRLGVWVSEFSQYKMLEWLPVFAFGTSYLSHPIVKLTFFTEESDLDKMYAGGAYNFPIYSRLKSVFSDDKISQRKMIRNEIAEISTSHGYTPNPWSTGIRDIVIDYGYVGTVVFLFLFGYFSQYIYQLSLKRREPEWLILTTITIVSCALFAMLSPFGLGVIINSFLFSVFLILTKQIKLKFRIT
jgi:oligosaccharide repeat unit polymerase